MIIVLTVNQDPQHFLFYFVGILRFYAISITLLKLDCLEVKKIFCDFMSVICSQNYTNLITLQKLDKMN